jgi:hypothetical protein
MKKKIKRITRVKGIIKVGIIWTKTKKNNKLEEESNKKNYHSQIFSTELCLHKILRNLEKLIKMKI